jgi:hypothetical protein
MVPVNCSTGGSAGALLLACDTHDTTITAKKSRKAALAKLANIARLPIALPAG